MTKTEYTSPGSLNKYKLTYPSGSQKWTDDRPYDDKSGEHNDKLKKDRLESPEAKRNLSKLSQAVREYASDNDQDKLRGCVGDVVVSLGREMGKEVLRAFVSELGDDKKDVKKVIRDLTKEKVGSEAMFENIVTRVAFTSIQDTKQRNEAASYMADKIEAIDGVASVTLRGSHPYVALVDLEGLPSSDPGLPVGRAWELDVDPVEIRKAIYGVFRGEDEFGVVSVDLPDKIFGRIQDGIPGGYGRRFVGWSAKQIVVKFWIG